MESVTEGLLPYRILEDQKSTSGSPTPNNESEGSPTDAVLFVGISLVLGIASRHLLRGTRVPYTVALLVIGIGLGSLEYGTSHELGKIGDGIRIWADIDPELLLAVFLPALLFESSFAMEVHQIKVYGANAPTRWSRSFDLNLLSWSCFKAYFSIRVELENIVVAWGTSECY